MRRVIEPILAGDTEPERLPTDDVQYVEDLGLITLDGQLNIANPIYQEIIPRELIYTTSLTISHQPVWYILRDGRLDLSKLLAAFQDFLREHSEHWLARFDYQEAGPQLLMQAFLHRIVNGTGRIEREYGLGRMRTDLLIAAGRLPEAQQVLRMLKEQEFYEFIRHAPDTDVRQTLASFNPFEAEQLAAYATESRQLVALASEHETLLKLTESDPLALTAEQEARLAALDKELDTAKQRFYATLDRIKAAFAGLSEERRQALAERQLLQGKDDRGLVRDLAAQAGSRVALLHTLVLEDRVHLLLTLPEVLLAREAPVGEAELNGLVQQLRGALQDPGGDPLPAAQALYRTLITPIAADLSTAGIDTLMVSLDGTLRYLPLAALHDGEHYLIERYALSVFTELGRDNLKLPPKAQWRGIGLGVSLPHAEVGPTRASFSALPAVPAELEAIIRRPEPDDLDGILPGRYYLDADFTASILRRALRAPVVHLASHFSLQPGNEAQSFLLLGDGSPLELRQLREQDCEFGRVDLLTLSACETAVGGRNAQGKEVESLGALVQQQGAKGVIATLWPVADASTGAFMQTLYRLRTEQHLTKAEALRQAQLAMLHGAIRPSAAIDQHRRPERLSEPAPPADEQPGDYRHPYYWAPFILMGNWL